MTPATAAEPTLKDALDSIEQDMLPPILKFSVAEKEMAASEPDYPDPQGEAIGAHNLLHLPPFGPQPDCEICREEGMV